MEITIHDLGGGSSFDLIVDKDFDWSAVSGSTRDCPKRQLDSSLHSLMAVQPSFT
jgi:hypothetical protein